MLPESADEIVPGGTEGRRLGGRRVGDGAGGHACDVGTQLFSGPGLFLHTDHPIPAGHGNRTPASGWVGFCEFGVGSVGGKFALMPVHQRFRKKLPAPGAMVHGSGERGILDSRVGRSCGTWSLTSPGCGGSICHSATGGPISTRTSVRRSRSGSPRPCRGPSVWPPPRRRWSSPRVRTPARWSRAGCRGMSFSTTPGSPSPTSLRDPGPGAAGPSLEMLYLVLARAMRPLLRRASVVLSAGFPGPAFPFAEVAPTVRWARPIWASRRCGFAVPRSVDGSTVWSRSPRARSPGTVAPVGTSSFTRERSGRGCL